MNKMSIRKDDLVVVLSGKDKGKQGKVLGTVPSEAKVVVEGINMVTCHVKPRKQGEEGGIMKREAALPPARSIRATNIPTPRPTTTTKSRAAISSSIPRPASSSARCCSYSRSRARRGVRLCARSSARGKAMSDKMRKLSEDRLQSCIFQSKLFSL